MAQINIGVIGTGGISGGHFSAYQKLPNVKLVGVADIVPERAKAAAEKWGAGALPARDVQPDRLDASGIDRLPCGHDPNF